MQKLAIGGRTGFTPNRTWKRIPATGLKMHGLVARPVCALEGVQIKDQMF